MSCCKPAVCFKRRVFLRRISNRIPAQNECDFCNEMSMCLLFKDNSWKESAISEIRKKTFVFVCVPWRLLACRPLLIRHCHSTKPLAQIYYYRNVGKVQLSTDFQTFTAIHNWTIPTKLRFSLMSQPNGTLHRASWHTFFAESSQLQARHPVPLYLLEKCTRCK